MDGRETGYTLVELVLVILIFSVAITLIATSFNRILASSGQIMRGAETDIAGMIGLELFRTDLELAGFGLPWSLPPDLTYSEATCPQKNLLYGDSDVAGFPGADLDNFNDAPGVPRAVVMGNNVGINGSDYLVLKGTALGMNPASQSWSYLNYSSTGALVKPSGLGTEKPSRGARVIVLRSGSLNGEASRELVTEGGSHFSLSFDEKVPDAFSPASRSENFLVYGVALADADHSLLPLEFPFNRSDYFIKHGGTISPFCARIDGRHGTGTLYKTVINQNGKSPTYYPILDCVADLQVLFYLDSNGDGEGDLVLSDLAEIAGSAAEIRSQLKEIRVFILAQQGKKDPGFLYPVTDPRKAIMVGDPMDDSLGSTWSSDRLAGQISPDWRNYHWKIYTIAVRLKNL